LNNGSRSLKSVQKFPKHVGIKSPESSVLADYQTSFNIPRLINPSAQAARIIDLPTAVAAKTERE